MKREALIKRSKQKITQILITLTLSISGTVLATEVDQFTHREDYESELKDSLEIINELTNHKLKEATQEFKKQFCTINNSKQIANKKGIDIYNRNMIHREIAFYIFNALASETKQRQEPKIPDNIGLIYALKKILNGPLQIKINRSLNTLLKEKYVNLNHSIFDKKLYPSGTILKVNGVLLGVDKPDHFFDQGYEYWIKSNYGKNIKKAVDFGTQSEKGYYGYASSGVFSFADLRANYDGLHFYIKILEGDHPMFSFSKENCLTQNYNFNWTDYITWEYDELLNPSIYYNHSRVKEPIKNILIRKFIIHENEVINFLNKKNEEYNYIQTCKYLNNNNIFNKYTYKRDNNEEYVNFKMKIFREKSEYISIYEEFCLNSIRKHAQISRTNSRFK